MALNEAYVAKYAPVYMLCRNKQVILDVREPPWLLALALR